MPKKKSGKKSIAKNEFYWAFYILAALGAFLGFVLMPIWENTSLFFHDWGSRYFHSLVAAILLLYVFLFLFGEAKNEQKKPLCHFIIVEISILFVVAIFAILQQLHILYLFGPARAFGVALWLRGCFYLTRAYILPKGKKSGVPVYLFITALGLISLGTYLLTHDFLGNTFLWLVSISILILAVASLVYGVLSTPSKAKKKSDEE